jgi:sugar/nucleoside kinase (ribokinase family)
MILSFLGSVACIDGEVVLRHLKKTEFLLITGSCSLPGLTKDGMKRIFFKARKNGTVTLLDPGWDPANWKEKRKEILSLLPLTDVFLPNLDEAKALTRKKRPLNMAKSLQEAGAKAVIIKMGKKGSLGLKEGRVVCEPAIKVHALNTTAAGEAFNAGIIYGLIRNWDLKKSMRFANTLAGLYVSSRTGEYPALNKINKNMEGRDVKR